MSKLVLIIEDDPYVQRYYHHLFSTYTKDFEVQISPNGEDGITKAQTLRPNLIFLDIVMPGLDGIQVLQKLKNQPDTKDIPVIMLTNLENPDTMDHAFRLGASGYIIKADTEPEDIMDLINKYIK